jgi:ABC-type iron transport system FetAB permease component
MQFNSKILDRNINWYTSSLLLIPLIILTYYISYINMGENKASGITGVLILFSYSQFFFQRRKLNYLLRTVWLFYIFGILSTLLISYTYFYTQYDWLSLLVIVQIYLFIQILGKTSFLSDKWMDELTHIVNERIDKKWYHGLIGSKTQLKENKYFIFDLIIFIVFIVIILFVKDKLF